MKIDLERVVRFYYVADELSFVRAALKLNLDQTWLSRQIQQLEAQLGCRLLERTTRHVKLTREGEEFLVVARELAEAAINARSIAHILEQTKSRELRLGISSSTFWIPARNILLDFVHENCREMAITEVVQCSTELLGSLRERSVDIAIAGKMRDMDGLDYLTLHKHESLLFVPREHPLASKSEIRMSDMQKLEIAVPAIDNEYAFELLYQPFLNAGAVPHWTGEGVLAAIHFATTHRICMVAWGFENALCNSMTLRKVADCDARLDVVVARNIGDERRCVRTVWALAKLVAKKAEMNHA